MKKILINATQIEESRIALVEDGVLIDLDVETINREQRKSNIYKGVITKVEQSLEAAFVDFGGEKHGFLPLKEIAREYFKFKPEFGVKVSIKDLVSEGQEVIVQVEKEERGNKGAALTTFISLAGRHLVLMPNNSKATGISKRIEGNERVQLKEKMQLLNIPENMGVIVRTASIGCTIEEMQWDVDYLVFLWKAILKSSKTQSSTFFLHQESNLIIRAVRDYLREDVAEVIIDDKDSYEKALKFVSHTIPSYTNRIKFYSGNISLFSAYKIENQIETAFHNLVPLPSGGSIVIDTTEALVAIDVNSSSSTKGNDIEDTALQTNLEACFEIARQLRLRDIGGLIVIDFIDMNVAKNQKSIEDKMKMLLEGDSTRVQIGKLSKFGLLEMSRQRKKSSLYDTNNHRCPRCSGAGFIRDIGSLSLSILRLMNEEANRDKTAKLVLNVPTKVASFLLNEKRYEISSIEKKAKIQIVIVPNNYLETPHYVIERIKDGAPEIYKQKFSYEFEGEYKSVEEIKQVNAKYPAVSLSDLPSKKRDINNPNLKIGLFDRILIALGLKKLNDLKKQGNTKTILDSRKVNSNKNFNYNNNQNQKNNNKFNQKTKNDNQPKEKQSIKSNNKKQNLPNSSKPHLPSKSKNISSLNDNISFDVKNVNKNDSGNKQISEKNDLKNKNPNLNKENHSNNQNQSTDMKKNDKSLKSNKKDINSVNKDTSILNNEFILKDVNNSHHHIQGNDVAKKISLEESNLNICKTSENSSNENLNKIDQKKNPKPNLNKDLDQNSNLDLNPKDSLNSLIPIKKEKSLSVIKTVDNSFSKQDKKEDSLQKSEEIGHSKDVLCEPDSNEPLKSNAILENGRASNDPRNKRSLEPSLDVDKTNHKVKIFTQAAIIDLTEKKPVDALTSAIRKIIIEKEKHF